MLKIGVVTIGQAGGNVAEALVALSFDVIAMNSSNEDLNKFKSGDICSFYKMGGASVTGCAKERSIAIDLVRNDFQEIVKAIQTEFADDEVDIFNIVASAGGGTGSGSAPLLCKILKQAFDGVEVIATIVLPDREESIKALSNAIECVQELERMKVPILLYDNEKVRKVETSQKAIYANINTSIANDMLYIRGDNRPASEIGNIDDRDMLKIITTPGVISVTHVTIKENMLDRKSIDTSIVEAIKANKFIPLEDDKVVRRIGIVTNLPKSISTELDMGFNVIKDEVGEPLEIHHHIYDEDKVAKSNEGTLTIICSGLSYPINRMNDIAKRINNRQEAATVARTENLNDARNAVGWLNADDASRVGKHKPVKVSANLDKINLDIN